MNSTETKIPRMVSIREAAELTGLSYDYLRKLCLQNRIVFVAAGNRRFINLDKLILFLNGGHDISVD